MKDVNIWAVVAYILVRGSLGGIVIPEGLLLLLYSLWIAIGLYSYLEHTSKDPQSVLLDLLKSIVAR